MAAEVALQQLDGIRAQLAQEGDSLEGWLVEMGLIGLDWRNLEFRLSWSDYAKILDWVLARRSPQWMNERGDDSIYLPEAHLFQTGLLVGFDQPGPALEWMCGPVGPFAAVSPYLQNRLEQQGPDQYLLRTKMRDGLTPCLAHHFYSQGVLAGFPRVLAEAPAEVHLEPQPDGADYQIRFAASKPLASIKRRWRRGRPQPQYLAGIGETYLSLVQRQIELQAQQELVRQAEVAAARAEKQESLGHLTSGVAHDFRNLLTVAQGQLELVLLDEQAGPRRARLEEVLNTCQRGSKLTERLLAYAREAPGVPEDVDVSEVLTSVQPILEKGLGKKGELRLSLQDAAQKICVERGQLENALLNLVVNAGDAISSDGLVTITSEVTQINADSGLAAECIPGDYVRISVQDNGKGIDPDIAAQVFDPYFTTKDQGTGLGLSSVWGFVKQNGGHVTLAQNPNQGCRFDLYLPRH